jgi:hypothetical protein
MSDKKQFFQCSHRKECSSKDSCIHAKPHEFRVECDAHGNCGHNEKCEVIEECKSKMYILLLDTVDLGHSVLSAAHASLSCYLTFESDPDVRLWATHSFRKVTCRVTEKEFKKALTYGTNMVDYRVITEMALDNQEIAIAFKPKEEWPNFFKSLKLYK